MFKTLNNKWKSQKPTLSDKPFLKKLTANSSQKLVHSTLNVGKFLNGANKTNSLFFTFNAQQKKIRSYQQRFISINKIELEWQTLLKKLQNNDASLIKLNLGFKQIGAVKAEELALALKTNRTLAELDLYSNNIGNAGTKALATALKDNHTLIKLGLGSNQIGAAGAEELALALKTNRTLAELNLCSNNIGNAGTKALATALKDNRVLMELRLASNHIGATGAIELASALKSNRSLVGLNLWGNNIADEGATALANALQTNRTLREVGLTHNQILDKGARELAVALKSNLMLRSLGIACNKISHEGAIELALMLKDNRTLARLDLSGNVPRALRYIKYAPADPNYFDTNRIGDRGARALADALKVNRTLTSLDITWNEVSDEGAKELVIALRENYTLTEFELRGTHEVLDVELVDERITDEMAKEIDAIITRNCALRDMMHEAVKIGDISAVNRFLQRGVSLLAISGNENNTALHWAVIAKQHQMTAHLFDLMRQQRMPLDNKNRDGRTAADLAKGTELEALFTSVMPILSNSHLESTSTSACSANDKNKLAYTVSQSFMPPPKDKNGETAKPNQDGYTPKSKR